AQALDRREEGVEALELLGAAVERDRPRRAAHARALRGGALRVELALGGPQRGEVKGHAEEEHAEAQHAGRAQFGEKDPQRPHEAPFSRASTVNWIGRRGSSSMTWWLARCTSASTWAAASRSR